MIGLGRTSQSYRGISLMVRSTDIFPNIHHVVPHIRAAVNIMDSRIILSSDIGCYICVCIYIYMYIEIYLWIIPWPVL